MYRCIGRALDLEVLLRERLDVDRDTRHPLIFDRPCEAWGKEKV